MKGKRKIFPSKMRKKGTWREERGVGELQQDGLSSTVKERQRQIWRVGSSSRSWKGLEDFLASEGGSKLQVMRGWPSSREGPSEVAPKKQVVKQPSFLNFLSNKEK